jgi:small subunit ribosomal protein S20
MTRRMANTLSARKRVRASLRKRQYNRAGRSAVKTLVARARRSSDTPEAGTTATELRQAVRALDKAAEKGILHPNNAARRKSRLMRALARSAAQSRPAAAAAGKPAQAQKRAKR